MVIQKELMLSQLKNMPLRNRQMYDMVKSIGKGYKASANNMDTAEVINSAQKRQEMMAIIDEVTTNVAFSFGLSDPQKLNKKLEEIRQELLANSKDGKVTKGDLKKKIEKILKSRLKDAFEKAGLDYELVEELEDKEIADEKKQDEQHNDLFELVNSENNVRLKEMEDKEKASQLLQKNVYERSLTIMLAMKKVRESIVQNREMLEIDLSFLKELDSQELSKQMKFLGSFGLTPMMIEKEGQIRENPERTIELETITKEDLEQGDIIFAIPIKELQSKNWEEKTRALTERFKDKGVEVEEPSVKVAKDVPVLMRGKDEEIKIPLPLGDNDREF